MLEPPISLLPEPTPLHPLPRISEELGREVWIKRDDLTAVGVGGNKIRKLEFLLGEALDQGADTLITIGAAQSNHCRAVAAAAAVMGMDAHLVLGGSDPGNRTGNLLLDDYLGATLEFCEVDDWATLFARAEAAAQAVQQRGGVAFTMPAGGSTPTGALGFARAYAELLEQCDRQGLSPTTVVHATGSGGTQAGLIAGRELLGGGPAIVGVTVALEGSMMAPVVDAVADGALALVAQPVASNAQPGTASTEDANVRREPAVVIDGYLGDDYGVPTEAAEKALLTLLRREGILLDPVYTAKAFSAVLAADQVLGQGPLVFWHTGGAPAVFAERGDH
ncbi:MAG: 1-aminocyclopropane-1-carboxylate deaminase/D-cysteine desulfhydrase [Candidatus Nanopelagicales bacterium]